MFFDYIIPDVPKNVFIQQQREKYIIRMALLDDWAKGGDEDSRALVCCYNRKIIFSIILEVGIRQWAWLVIVRANAKSATRSL